MLPIPEIPTEEGGVLYRQYFCRFGMTPELRKYIMQTKNWTSEQITVHIKYLAKLWRQRKREYARRTGVNERKKRYRPGVLVWTRYKCLQNRLWTSHNAITGFQQPVIESKFPGLTLVPTRMWTKQETTELLSMSLTIYYGWLAYMNLSGNNLE